MHRRSPVSATNRIDSFSQTSCGYNYFNCTQDIILFNFELVFLWFLHFFTLKYNEFPKKNYMFAVDPKSPATVSNLNHIYIL